MRVAARRREVGGRWGALVNTLRCSISERIKESAAEKCVCWNEWGKREGRGGGQISFILFRSLSLNFLVHCKYCLLRVCDIICNCLSWRFMSECKFCSLKCFNI